MKSKRKYLITLLLAANIYHSYALAEEQVNLITEPTALNTLIQILEKGETGVLDQYGLQKWQGKLSNHDLVLRDYLVESNLYNFKNADIFIRSITQDEVQKLIETLNDKNLNQAINVVAATKPRAF